MKRKNTLKNITGSLAALALCAVLPFMLSCWSDLDELHDMSQSKTYNLRDRGPAGGWIFHIVDNGDGMYTYYEAAPEEEEGTSLQWLSSQTWLNGDLAGGETLESIGTGAHNTAKILEYKGARTAQAAVYCDGLTFSGYSDWFLPSRHELDMMCWNLHGKSHDTSDFHEARGEQEDNPDVPVPVGGFAEFYYWSSSECSEQTVYRQSFINGTQQDWTKDSDIFRVRAVRAFTN